MKTNHCHHRTVAAASAALFLLAVAASVGGAAAGGRGRSRSFATNVARRDLDFSSGGSGHRNETGKDRTGKFFPIFNIVTFKHQPCNTSSGDTGTCMSMSDCVDRTGADIEGQCAAGFGVCCVFYLGSCGATVTQNCSYITNPGYPSTYNTAGSCNFVIKQCSNDICFIRLDYDRFEVRNVDFSATTQGNCAFDSWAITSPTGNNPPTICGINDGQHMYVDAAFNDGGDISIAGTFTGTTFNRIWKIKVSQIECGATHAPPPGCHMYHTGAAGQVRSHNFGQTSSSEFYHLNDQFYTICIRTEAGMCSIVWSQSDDTNSFKLIRPSTNLNSRNGEAGCLADWVVIPQGYNEPGLSCIETSNPAATAYVNRFCGGTLTCIDDVTQSAPIYSDVQPFTLGVNFNNVDGLLAGTSVGDRGFCLNYRQLPC